MRLTLAKLLAQAVKDIAEFRSTTIDQHGFMDWVDKYQAQLVVLASQIRLLFSSFPITSVPYFLNLVTIMVAISLESFHTTRCLVLSAGDEQCKQ